MFAGWGTPPRSFAAILAAPVSCALVPEGGFEHVQRYPSPDVLGSQTPCSAGHSCEAVEGSCCLHREWCGGSLGGASCAEVGMKAGTGPWAKT
ncbi:hypothetical protein BKA70DRAFT_1279520 [Coprinopsis sp. MPI-PUGE-AT-0042]|nr:hypothetical protein BKA70DRAFT_1279520 [Coprinopsis sp. MPI-PUGE-AT-0042]